MKERLYKVCDSMSESQRVEIPKFKRLNEEIEKSLNESKEAKQMVARTRNIVRNSLIDFDKIHNHESAI
jgi:hypothetical protein